MAKNLFMVRHGEPEAGYTKRFLGRLDPGLSPHGVEQARRIAGIVASLKPCRCLSSPLRRAAGTAEIVAEACGLAVETNDLLLEVDFGAMEGKTFKEAHAENPGVIDSWYSLAGDFAFPGGESHRDVERRAVMLADLVRSAPEDNLLLVAHGGILRGLLCTLLDVPANGPLRFRLAYASLTTLELHSFGGAVLTGFNVGRDYPP